MNPLNFQFIWGQRQTEKKRKDKKRQEKTRIGKKRQEKKRQETARKDKKRHEKRRKDKKRIWEIYFQVIELIFECNKSRKAKPNWAWEEILLF